MKKNISEIIDRIKRIKGFSTDEEVAISLGMTKGNLSSYKTRGAIPFEQLSTFCEQEQVSLDWVLTEEGEMRRELRAAKEGTIALKEDFIEASVYAFAGAGGAVELVEPEPIDIIVIPKSFFKASILPVKIRGRSNEPTIFDGAIVGVDRENRQVVSGEMYAVWLPYEGAIIKRLYVDAQNLTLKSDNPAFPSFSIPLKEVEDHFILGRVKWVIQEL